MALEEYLDLLIWTFNITKDARILPIVLQKNNLRPMYEKLPHAEQARWWTHTERHDILDQPVPEVYQSKIPGGGHLGQPCSN
jgi:hypothetical protein